MYCIPKIFKSPPPIIPLHFSARQEKFKDSSKFELGDNFVRLDVYSERFNPIQFNSVQLTIL